MKNYLEVRDLTHFYGKKKVLEIESLKVRKGEVFVLLGPNGAGKSTLLRLLHFLEKPTLGEIKIDGKVVQPPERLSLRRKMAGVFGEPLLFNTTVWQNVAYGLKIRKYPGEKVVAKVAEVLKKLGIFHLSSRPASTLSTGEAKRSALARALVLEPEILFLDEPLSGLDYPTKEELQRDLKKVLKEKEQTAFYVTHDQTEAQVMADRLAVMKEGRVLQVGRPQEIFEKPQDKFVARFVGMETLLPGEIISRNEGLAKVGVGQEKIEVVLNGQYSPQVLVGIRPEDITLTTVNSKQLTVSSQQPAVRSSARNQFSGKIVRIVPQGPTAKVYLEGPLPLAALITKKSLEELELEVGEGVLASFKATAVHVIEKDEQGVQRKLKTKSEKCHAKGRSALG